MRSTGGLDVPLELLVLWVLVAAEPVAVSRGCPCHISVTWCARRPLPPLHITIPVPCRAPRT